MRRFRMYRSVLVFDSKTGTEADVQCQKDVGWGSGFSSLDDQPWLNKNGGMRRRYSEDKQAPSATNKPMQNNSSRGHQMLEQMKVSPAFAICIIKY